MYAAPRFYRILLTVFMFLWVTTPFGIPDKIFNQETTNSSLSSDVESNTVGPTLCVQNFNRAMGSSASASYERGDTKINVIVHEILTEAEANQIASNIADKTFSTCSLVDSIDITFEGYTGALIKHRP